MFIYLKKTAEGKIRREMKEGLTKARNEEKEQIVKNLIISFGFTDVQAASAVDVSIAFVKKVLFSLKKK